jgi:hypothetical protein
VSEALSGPTFFSELMREVQKQQKELAGKNPIEVLTKFVTDIRSVANEFATVLRDAARTASGGQVSDAPKNDKDKTIIDLVSEMMSLQQQRGGQDNKAAGNSTRTKRDTSGATNGQLVTFNFFPSKRYYERHNQYVS